MSLKVPPYERTRDKVALVGMHPLFRHLAPYDDDEYEVWSLNEAYTIPEIVRWDRWFQMHPKWDYMRPTNRDEPGLPAWMTNEDDRRAVDFPVYMLEQYDHVPGCVRYPHADIVESFPGNEEVVNYFGQTFDYMMALAIWMKFEAIAPFGFEMPPNTEYATNRDSANFWCGIAAGRNIVVKQCEHSVLLRGDRPLYGYDKVPGFGLTHAEVYLTIAKNGLSAAKQKISHVRGQATRVFEELEGHPDPTPAFVAARKQELARLLTEEQVVREQGNVWVGHVNAFNRVVADIKGVPTPAEVAPILPEGRYDVIDTKEMFE